jgi:hypothetical protein
MKEQEALSALSGKGPAVALRGATIKLDGRALSLFGQLIKKYDSFEGPFRYGNDNNHIFHESIAGQSLL